MEFQSTRPRGARHFFYIIVYHILGFNPRARVGRDRGTWEQQRRGAGVSIHAPAWGATYDDYLTCKTVHVSIHAPAWGATWGGITVASWRGGFNPRARVGRDALLKRYAILDNSFNPRARVGRDSLQLCYIVTWRCFNPRARVGRDIGIPDWGYPFAVSIHAPAWGATTAGASVNPPAVSFNPRARVGRDLSSKV